MNNKRIISGLLASLMLMSSVNVVSANELNQVLEAGKDGSSLLYVNQEVTDFKVVVPLNLPITMDKYGTTLVANNAYIINKSYGPVKVIDVDVDGANGWSIVGYGDDYSKMKVGSKKIGMFIQTDITKEDGTFDFDSNSWNVIQGQGGRHEVIYRGKLPAQHVALDGEIVANTVFTFDWNTDLDNKSIPTTKHEEQVNTDDIGYDSNYDVVNLDLWEYEFSEEINGYILTSYTGEYVDGKIVGTVPAYISKYVVAENNTNTKLSANLLSIAYAEEENRVMYPVKEMDSTFSEELTTAPELPNTVETLNDTFKNSTNLEGTINITNRIKNLTENALPKKMKVTVANKNIDAISVLRKFNILINDSIIDTPTDDNEQDDNGQDDNEQNETPIVKKGLFELTTGMTMQEFVDNGYAEANKAYDSYGNEISNWSSNWTFYRNKLYTKSDDITKIPTNIPVIANQQVITDVTNMFSGCKKITTMDLSNWDTSNITNMQNMFNSCDALKEINFGDNFDTSKVTNMKKMFYSCDSLTNLDLSSFDTSNVTDMTEMFYYCTALTSLDVSSFDTSNVTNMANMFKNCNVLTNLDVSNWDTTNVTDMGGMFYECNALISLNLNNWDTSNVTNMYNMFVNCKALTSLDLSSFDTGNVTLMGNMFNGCSGLIALELGNNFDTKNVTTMLQMFAGCSELTNLDVSNFDLSNTTTTQSMFIGCSKLTSLDLSSWKNTNNLTEMHRMFENCTALTSVDVSGLDTSKVTHMAWLFKNCSSLTSVDLSNFDTSNVLYLGEMFYGCNNLTSVNVSSFNTTKTTHFDKMFYECNSLTNLDISNFNTTKATRMGEMFRGCTNLKTIYVGEKWKIGSSVEADYMFINCGTQEVTLK